MHAAKIILCTLAAAAVQTAAAQADPLSLPTPRPASAGAYQWGLEMLRFDRAWALTKGRAHLAMSEKGAIAPHDDLGSGLGGPLRPHISQDMDAQPILFHSTMTTGVLAARGFNGVGIAGACPFCSVSLHNGDRDSIGSFNDAIEGGAVAINYSAGASNSDVENPSCARAGTVPPQNCRVLERAEERDVVFVTIAGNLAANRVSFPANFPTALGIAGLQPDGQFWAVGYDRSNPGSSYGPEIKLLAPARDVLATQPVNGVYADTPGDRCGDRFDSIVGAFPSLPAEYTGYGDCTGTSFSAPWVTALVGLMRSADPLLSAADVRAIILDTATLPVAGPAGSGLTFHIPDADAAMRRVLGPGVNNKLTPMFSLYASSSGHHLFTSSPQSAVAAAAGEFLLHGLANAATYASFGDPVPGYEQFKGRICINANSCITVPARKAFYLYSTENSPTATALVPLYRLSQVCAPGPGCATTRAFAYATSDAGVHALEARGYVVDEVEGFVYTPESPAPARTVSLCLGFDAARIDHILYAAPQCDRTELRNSLGETTGGNYAQVAPLGYVPASGVTSADVNHTAMWWNPDEPGWGVSFAHQGDVVFATLFVYDAEHKPMWLVMSQGLRQSIVDIPGAGDLGVFAGPLYRTTGSAFNARPVVPLTSANVTQVGAMRVRFGSTATTLTYDVNGAAVTKTIQKQIFSGRAPTCRTTTSSRAGAVNYQDMWWNPAESGWGINIAHQGDVIFATLFTYDLDGKDLWLVLSDGVRQSDGSYLGDLYRASGSSFDAPLFTPLAASDVTRVGTMRLRFSDGVTAALDYTVDGIAVSKSITRQVFASPVAECTP
jgi:serine protease